MSELVFVTGASGLLGSHIVVQLLNAGYRVRAAARGSKVAVLQQSFARFGDKFEAVTISDITTEKMTDALKGVDAVIHAATPMPSKHSTEAVFTGAVEGTLNVIRQAEAAGIKRIVVTSSIATVANPRQSFTDQDWNPTTKEEALDSTDKLAPYMVAKTLAEKKLWEFGDAHPHLEITTFNPPFFYGPFAEGFKLPVGDYWGLSTDLFIYHLLSPSGTFPVLPAHVDVRDVAKAHVLALKSPPTSAVGRKRIVFASPHDFDFKAIVDLIAEKRPQVKERLIKSTAPDFPFKRVPVDFGRIQQVLGLGKDNFHSIEATMLDTVDSLLEIEKEWISEGHVISIPKL